MASTSHTPLGDLLRCIPAYVPGSNQVRCYALAVFIVAAMCVSACGTIPLPDIVVPSPAPQRETPPPPDEGVLYVEMRGVEPAPARASRPERKPQHKTPPTARAAPILVVREVEVVRVVGPEGKVTITETTRMVSGEEALYSRWSLWVSLLGGAVAIYSTVARLRRGGSGLEEVPV